MTDTRSPVLPNGRVGISSDRFGISTPRLYCIRMSDSTTGSTVTSGKRRVVVTGIGLISPVGVGNAATWDGVLGGTSGIAPITHFDAQRYSTRFAGEVKGFDPLQWLEKKDVKKCARFIHFALACTTMAMGDSGLTIGPDNAARVGVIIGSGIGGFEIIEKEHSVLLERGPDRVSPDRKSTRLNSSHLGIS